MAFHWLHMQKNKGKKQYTLVEVYNYCSELKENGWEDPNYGVKEWGIPYGSYSSLMNKYWIRPGKEGQSKNAMQVEGGCYW